MANIFIENRDQWLRMAEVDYLGHFVKAWLAFNAWYRSAYNSHSDRAIIDEIKWHPNQIGNKLRPLLINISEDGAQFRAEIGLLHHRLENYELYCGKGTEKERITLTNIYLKENPLVTQSGLNRGYSFLVERMPNKQVRTEARKRKGEIIFDCFQARFDLPDLEANPGFKNGLTVNMQAFLRQLYRKISPRLVEDLTSGTEREIKCGAHEFRCGRDSLFAGMVEAIYLMRCTLFHGELTPTKEATACYEPAYRLVRRFLDCVS